MKVILVSMLMLVSASGMATEDAKPEQAHHNFPVAEQLSAGGLLAKQEEYLRERKWRLGSNERADGSSFYLGWGEASVAVGSGDLAFPDARVAAFEEALLLAKGEFVKNRVQTITAETLNQARIDDRPFDVDELQDDRSRARVIADKLAAATEAGLDRLLERLGEDPKSLDKQNKRVLAKNLLSKTATITAMASVAGLRPLVTFEDAGQVGVLVVYSDAQRELARSIAAGTALAEPRKAGPLPIRDLLSKTIPEDNLFPFQHGVRIIYDDKGNPWLLSFAQQGVRVTKQTSRLKRDMLLRGSRQAAADLARAQMAEFLKGSVNFASRTDFMAQSEISEIEGPGGLVEQESVVVGKLVDNKISQFAEVRMTGVTTLKTWMTNHPDTGHLIVGEVVAWSPITQAAARSTSALHQSSRTPEQQSAPAVPTRSSADFEAQGSF